MIQSSHTPDLTVAPVKIARAFNESVDSLLGIETKALPSHHQQLATPPRAESGPNEFEALRREIAALRKDLVFCPKNK